MIDTTITFTPPDAHAARVDHALYYASLGWHVMPLHTLTKKTIIQGAQTLHNNALFCTCPAGQRLEVCPNGGKHPWSDKELGFTRGLKQATSDADTLRKWWKTLQLANIGIVTGLPSNLIVVDIDPKNGGDTAWFDLCAAHSDPDTLKIRTGSGGYHYYFLHPGDGEYKSKAHGIAPGVDCKADGGYVVAPPSLHASGNFYTVLNPGATIAPMPSWLLDKLERRDIAPDGADATRTSPSSATPNTSRTRSYSQADAAKVENACAWLAHCHADAAHLGENEWYWMLSILARCDGGTQLAHQWSAPYPAYNTLRTDEKLAHALEASGPITCATIETLSTHCASCPQRGRVKSPVSLGGSREVKCANFTWSTALDDEGNEKKVQNARASTAIVADLFADTDGWPCVVDGKPFVIDASRVSEHDATPFADFLTKPDELFAWISLRMPIAWMTGCDKQGMSYLTKQEFHHVVSKRGKQYDAVERYPHEPHLPNHYYLWNAPTEYVPNGKYFETMLTYITNTVTDADRALLRAMFMVPAWGCPHGKRPMFVIEADAVGSGKTTITDILGLLYGGILEYKHTAKGEEEFMTRLLSPAARHQRIVRIDNAKGELGGQFLEYLVTANIFSGRELYEGEGSRPNTCTTVVTGNTVRLSEDIASRCYFIRLHKPTSYDPGWDTQIKGYVQENRDKILADIVWTLGMPCEPTTANDRWTIFVHEILTRCPEASPNDVVNLALQRRGTHDNDTDEAVMILEALRQYTDVKVDDDDLERPWYFVSRAFAREPVEHAIGAKITSKAFGAMMKRHIDAGHFGGMVQEYRRGGTRGWSVCHGVGVAQSCT